jgi:L-asparaginase / beta-aspartyl-peptidase
MSNSYVTPSTSPRRWTALSVAVLLGLALIISLTASLRPASADPTAATQAAQPNKRPGDVVLAIHVGTASLREGSTSPEVIEAYQTAMTAALEAGRDALLPDGNPVDAVQAAIEVLEDEPTFNAGRGAVFNTDAMHELDASIMDGATIDAGAVAGIRNVKNPIAAARLVLDESPHVLLAGQGADTFALRGGLETVTQDYFFTQSRWDALLNAKNQAASTQSTTAATDEDEEYHGTVGAVARGLDGHMAAGTSTGGRTNKDVGRVGDSPLVSAGTWAKNGNVAVSGTGLGEVYIRLGAARDVGALYEYRYRNDSERAANEVLDKIRDLDGTGGLLVLDDRGRLSTPRTGGMPTGYVLANGEIVLDIFRTD